MISGKNKKQKKMSVKINNKEEFEQFYPYDNKNRIDYPKIYPYICEWRYDRWKQKSITRL